ncbi:hypothetical protein FS842_009180 [Serendipita sp. 407]|nr:hypothetical protein FS842_009180 [Serendipita sp. 407]
MLIALRAWTDTGKLTFVDVGKLDQHIEIGGVNIVEAKVLLATPLSTYLICNANP